MSSVVDPQSVPSRISVVLVEEAEVWGAECLDSAPVDKALRLLAGAACPASVTVWEDGIIMLPILLIGLLDCGSSPLGCSDWLSRLSWWVWLAGRRMSMRRAVVVCPGGVRIVYIRRTLIGSSSLDAAPVTAAELSLWVLLGGADCIWLAGLGLFFWQVVVTLVMATDSAAAAGGRAGITFGVELVVPWDAPEAVVDLHSNGVMDHVGTIPDVIGLTGRRPGAAVCRILHGRDVQSVRALVPDSRWLE